MRTAKRLLDIGIALTGLVVLSPLLGFLAALILVKMGKPVLFRQVRPGLNGEPFTIYKFRTMSNDRDDAGNPLADEQRLNSLGTFLRNNSLDELPELWNVLRGDMSLVGPRPLLMQYLPRYTSEQKRRHNMKPGITGWAQVNGRNAVSWNERFKMDVWYVDHWSFWLDLKILLLTGIKILTKEGITAEGHVTMPEFLGPENQNQGR